MYKEASRLELAHFWFIKNICVQSITKRDSHNIKILNFFWNM